jgi:lipopolysaccharide export system permease protein
MAMRMRSYRTLNVYMIRELLFSLAIAFLFYFFIFFINQLLLMAERILSRKVPFWDVFRLVVYSIPLIVTYALPFGTLVGTLMAVGRLVSDREILAFRSSGITFFRLFAPVLFMGVIFGFSAFVFSDFFLPLGNIKLKTLSKQVFYKNPGIELEPFTVNKYEDIVIVTGNVENNVIQSMLIIDRTQENKKRGILADSAFLEPNPEQLEVITLRLENVFWHVTDPRNQGTYEYGSAEVMEYNLPLKDIGSFLISPGPFEMSSVDVLSEVRGLQRQLRMRNEKIDENISKLQLNLVSEVRASMEELRRGLPLSAKRKSAMEKAMAAVQRERERPRFDRNLQSYLLEFHRKLASAFSCVVFIVFSFPMGLYARKSGRMVGFGIGAVMSGVYWGLLLVSFRLGVRVDVPPALAMWAPNVLVLLIGVGLIAGRVRR